MGPNIGEIMAINKNDYINKVDVGLKADKTFTHYFYRFKLEGKEYAKTFDISNSDWDKKTKKEKAKQYALKYKEDTLYNSLHISSEFDINSTLNDVANEYFKNVCSDSIWDTDREASYKLYLSPVLGKKKIKDITLNNINTIRLGMEKKGHSEQTKNGCSPRTIKKVLIQTLKPIMQYAIDNNIIAKHPKIELSKHHTKANAPIKKIVKNGGVKLASLNTTICTIYSDDGFYRALFLFALFGRRWNEIRTLQWSDIDLLDGTYTIQAKNNKINEEQTYELPELIREALGAIKDNNKGLVFKSPVTGKELYSPKKQLVNIKKHLEKDDNDLIPIPELTMHYFRHILVSAMGEIGTATTVLSASLGHTNLKTVNQFYLSANHTKGSKVANQTIKEITNMSVNNSLNKNVLSLDDNKGTK